MGEPQPGVALLALRSRALVLPIGIWGSETAWPIGRRFPRPGTVVKIRIGEPYRPADSRSVGTGAARNRRHDVEAASEELMVQIAALLPPEYRGRFG